MKRNDLSRALVAFDQDSTIVAVVELSLKTWLVSGLVPGVMRQPLKKQPADPERLLALLHRLRDEAVQARRARRRGLCDPRFEPRRVARTSPRQDRPARHRDADAGVSRLAARRGAPLQYGGDPDAGAGRCQAADPRTRKSGRRAHPDHQSDDRDTG